MEIMTGDSSNVRRIQTAKIRQTGPDNAFYARITPAIQEAGLEDGGSFCYDMSSIEKYGKILAIGDSDTIDESSHEFTYNIRRGAENGDLWIPIPPEALSALGVSLEDGEFVETARLTVWAGPQMLFFKRKNAAQPLQFIRELGEEWLPFWGSISSES